MERVPEPERMDDADQAAAYASGDFAEAHDLFVRLFSERHPQHRPEEVLDLGCGPADPTRRFARAHPGCRITGIDAARAMIEIGERANREAGLAERITLVCGGIADAALPVAHYDTVLSNSLLHHLGDPMLLWSAVRRHARDRAAVFVMDLLRPADDATVHRLVERHAAGAPPLLLRDFERSLRAAYRPDEVRAQLRAADLAHFTVEVVSDRHLVAHGLTTTARNGGRG